MALPTLNLDDLDYQQLLEIMRGYLPVKDWSDHNPSDPGIAMLELIAWLAEMSLYRMNRVPKAHRDKFLKLLVDPPVPVTVKATLRLTSPRTVDFPLSPGLRFASDFHRGRRTMFESYARTVLLKPATGGEQLGELRLRAIRDLEDVELGVSDGSPNQIFAIPASPVLLDFGATTPGYNPNPRVRVGADEWELRGFLLTPVSQGNPLPRHFMIDEFESQVRFGDGLFGAIPPQGAVINLIHCQILEGPEALVADGDVRHLLNPEIVAGLAASETLEIKGNADAEGGENFFSPDERIRRGLEEFRDPTRLITAEDFERVVTQDFNDWQQRFNLAVGRPPDQDRFRRVAALMNRKPPLATGFTTPGHVTLMVLPAYDEAKFDLEDLTGKTKLVIPTNELKARLLSYLEPRRLITTRIHVVGAELKEISVRVVVVVKSQQNQIQMEQVVRMALRSYLSITQGYDDTRGWPLGRPVRRSQIFRVLEDLPDVDYVETLVLSPANAQGDVELNPIQLPVWKSLDNIIIKRV